MAGYALYATERGWASSPEEIATELNYLVIPRATRRGVTQKGVDHARNFIRKSAGNMKALLVDPVENIARLEDFPMVCCTDHRNRRTLGVRGVAHGE